MTSKRRTAGPENLISVSSVEELRTGRPGTVNVSGRSLYLERAIHIKSEQLT
jgi:hypothetical protein